MLPDVNRRSLLVQLQTVASGGSYGSRQTRGSIWVVDLVILVEQVEASILFLRPDQLH